MGGASSAEAAQQRRLILPDFDGGYGFIQLN